MKKSLRIIFGALSLLSLSATATSCHSIDDERLPPVNVNITFNTIGDWQLYGVAGAGDYREFIRSQRLPAGYAYKVSEYTGFGGLLLTCDPDGEYLVYDLACPVEANANVRIEIDSDNPLAGVARCPKCGSTYNLYGYGAPMAGEALKLNYGLQKYHIRIGSPTPPYAVITR